MGPTEFGQSRVSFEVPVFGKSLRNTLTDLERPLCSTTNSSVDYRINSAITDDAG